MIIGLSAGRDAPPSLRERVALDEQGQRAVLRGRGEGIAELVVLATCHRTEIYAAGDGDDVDIVHAVASLLPNITPTDQHDLRIMHGSEAIEHLFRVACGLDSLVIGEPQVMGQVRRALVIAQEEAAAGPVMSNVFGRAIKLGRRVRAETPLGTLGMSIGSIAAEHLLARFGTLDGRAGVVVGGGEAATDVALALQKAGARLAVVNRTAASAEQLASLTGAQSIHALEEMPAVFASSDFAVVAVSGGILVREAHLPHRPGTEPFVVIDLSTPKAVDGGAHPGVEVRDLEDLPGPRGPEVANAVIDAETMVRKEVVELERWVDTRSSGPVIRDLRARGASIARAEVERTLAGMDLDPDQRERLTALGTRIANKLLHGPSSALRTADDQTRALIQRIFGLDGTEEGR